MNGQRLVGLPCKVNKVKIHLNEPILKIETLKVRNLIDDYRSGLLVIPEFPREYVWKTNHAPMLLESLYRGFTVPSLLVWQSDEAIRSRRNHPRPSRARGANWLIDGQQMVITLSRSLLGDENIDFVFHPDKERFCLANATTKIDRNWFHFANIIDDKQYHRLHMLPRDRQSEQREAAFAKVRRILDDEIPLLRMVNYRFEDVVEIFGHISIKCVRLTKKEIEGAKLAARHSGFVADE